MMRNKIVRKNWLFLTLLTVLTIIGTQLLVKNNICKIETLIQLGSDFQYNLLSFAGVLAGFLFTGISILISAIDKERIQRLWNNHYLDTLYYSAGLGILSNIFVCILALIILCCSITVNTVHTLYNAQLTLTTLSIVYFLWCTYKSITLLRKMRSN